MNGLLEQFITQECTAYVRRLLEGAIPDSAAPRPHFEFNRFEITIERDANIVVLEDVLDATEAGVRHVPLAEFMAALKRCSALRPPAAESPLAAAPQDLATGRGGRPR